MKIHDIVSIHKGNDHWWVTHKPSGQHMVSEGAAEHLRSKTDARLWTDGLITFLSANPDIALALIEENPEPELARLGVKSHLVQVFNGAAKLGWGNAQFMFWFPLVHYEQILGCTVGQMAAVMGLPSSTYQALKQGVNPIRPIHRRLLQSLVIIHESKPEQLIDWKSLGE